MLPVAHPLPGSQSGFFRTAAALVLGLLLASAVSASVSTDTDFLDIATKLVSWSQGTLGSVLRLGSILIGMALAIKTQKLPFPLSVTLVSIYFPEVVDTIFGAVI